MPDPEQNTVEPESGNDAMTPEELSELKAQLEAEVKAKAEFEAQGAEKDARIAELDTEVSRLTQDVQALKGEKESLNLKLTELNGILSQSKESQAQAVAKYKSLIVGSNPTIPAELIQGASIDELNASVENARALVSKIREQVAKEAETARVPPGAPPRTGVEVEALSPTEKIKYGLRR